MDVKPIIRTKNPFDFDEIETDPSLQAQNLDVARMPQFLLMSDSPSETLKAPIHSKYFALTNFSWLVYQENLRCYAKIEVQGYMPIEPVQDLMGVYSGDL